jgi:ABC-type Fe3+ transport system permease subunit
MLALEKVAISALVLAAVLIVVWIVFVLIRRRVRRRAERLGYAGILPYLRATPKNDEEKRDAVNLFVMGMVLCFLGILFHPLAILGVVYLYYGGRKIGYVLLGVDRSVTEDSRAGGSAK